MKAFNNVFNYVRYARASKLVVASVFVLALATFVSANLAGTQQSADAATSTNRSCTDNDIIRCGTYSGGETASHIRQNKTGDLPAIYSAYGLQTNELDRFASTARLGTAYKNGNIVVDNEIVATDSFSIGRVKKSKDVPLNINGKTYYGAYSKDVFGSDSIPVLVMFDKEGAVEAAILTACGNPVHTKPKKPSASCDMLNKTAVAGKKDTYNFSTKYSQSNGAKVAKVVYNFGDGTPEVTKTNPAEVVPHTYTKVGKFTAKVTVYFNMPHGAPQKVVSGPQCTTPIEVKEVKKPVYACDALKAVVVSETQRTFTSAVTAKDGATLKHVVYNFGDGSAEVTKTNVNEAVPHTYAPGSYTARVTAHFNVNGKVETSTNEKCTVPVKVKEQPKPVFSCDALNTTGTGANRSFTSNVTAKDGATLVNVTYNFGDNTAEVVKTNPAEAVAHTYAPGTYTARVTAKISVNGQT